MYKFSEIMWTKIGPSRTITDVALSLCYEGQTINSHFVMEETGRWSIGTVTYPGLGLKLGLSGGYCLEIFFPLPAALHFINL